MKFNLDVINQEQTVSTALLEVVDESDGVTLILTIPDEKKISEKDTFPFVALCKIRSTLEQVGLKLCCKGSRLDVHPSGRMLVGFNAYKLKMGQQATEENIVGLFDKEEDYRSLGSVKNQEDYYDAWLKSL